MLYVGLRTMVLKGDSLTTIYSEVSSGTISLLSHFFISHLPFPISHLTFLSLISFLFYLASNRIFYLASCISYVACRIFFSNLA